MDDAPFIIVPVSPGGAFILGGVMMIIVFGIDDGFELIRGGVKKTVFVVGMNGARDGEPVTMSWSDWTVLDGVDTSADGAGGSFNALVAG